MAIIRKCKLSWAASNGDDVVGYKIYWAYGTTVGYHCESFEVGKVAQTAIPDGICLSRGPVMFGITALDKDGNESDMTALPEPFEPNVPDAPGGLSLKPADAFTVVDDPRAEIMEITLLRRLVEQLEANRAPLPIDPPVAADERSDEALTAQFDIGSLF